MNPLGCSFVMENFGLGNVSDLLEHVAICTNCREALEYDFESYRRGTDPIVFYAPLGNSRINTAEALLRAAHVVKSREVEVAITAYNELAQAWREKSEGLFKAILALFASQRMVLRNCREFREDETRRKLPFRDVLEIKYRRILELVGPGAFETLFDLDEGQGVEELLAGWENLIFPPAGE